MATIKRRLIEGAFLSLLNRGKALLLIGPRQVGKTTFWEHLEFAEEPLFLNAEKH